MGPELDQPKGRPEVILETVASKENRGISIDPRDKSASNHRVHTLEMKDSVVKPLGASRSIDLDVDITGSTDSGGNELVEAESLEATECSSSFDDTDSDIANAANLSDSEVTSNLHQNSSSAPGINEFHDVFRMRRKKLTSHWRTFIQPLMWRCKWVELQIRKLNQQALKYSRDLADYNQRKHSQSESFKLDGCGVKSVPFPYEIERDKVLKRKKRRRIEDAMDVASYMSHHNLFGYYETKIHTGDRAYLNEDRINQVVNSTDKKGNDEAEPDDGIMWLQSVDGDNYIEETYPKIESLLSKVSNLKARLNKVISENARKFSLADNLGLLVPSDGLTSPGRSLTSPPKNGDRTPEGSSNFASPVVSRYNTGNVIIPESAVSSYGEVSYLPNIINCTDWSRLGFTGYEPEEDILIYNERLKEGINNFDEVRLQPLGSPQVAETRLEVAHVESTVPTDLVEPDLPTVDQPAPKIRSISKLIAPKNRKKGRKKAGSGMLRRRSSS